MQEGLGVRFSKQPVFATRAQRRCDVRGCRDEESRRIKKERPAVLKIVEMEHGRGSAARETELDHLIFLTPTSELLFLLGRLENLHKGNEKVSSVLVMQLGGNHQVGGCVCTNLERAEQALVYAHHGTCIVKLATVVGSTEQGDELALREELVAIFHDLMGTADEVHVVLL
jgi:hypothetical protein